MRQRPQIVTLVAGFLFAATLIACVVGVSLLMPGTALDRIWSFNRAAYGSFKPLGRLSGILLLLLGVCTFAAGRGLLHGRRWARWLAIAVFAVNGLGDAVNFVVTHDLIKSGSGVMIAGMFLFFLFRPEVAEYFRSAMPN